MDWLSVYSFNQVAWFLLIKFPLFVCLDKSFLPILIDIPIISKSLKLEHQRSWKEFSSYDIPYLTWVNITFNISCELFPQSVIVATNQKPQTTWNNFCWGGIIIGKKTHHNHHHTTPVSLHFKSPRELIF